MIAIALWSIGGGSDEGRRRREARESHRARERYASREDSREPSSGRRHWLTFDRPRLAGLIVLGGWFLVEAAVLSLSKGIVHPYYVSALGPGAAAMIGGGAVAFVAPGAWRGLRLALVPFAVGATVAAQLTLLGYEPHYMRWFWPVLIVGAALGVAALLVSRRTEPRSPAPRSPADRRSDAISVSAGQRLAMALILCLLLIAPATYAASTWEFAVEGTFPAAGPRAAGSVGPLGVDPYALRVTKALVAYVSAHHPGTRWDVLTEASDTAAPMILLGYDAGRWAATAATTRPSTDRAWRGSYSAAKPATSCWGARTPNAAATRPRPP